MSTGELSTTSEAYRKQRAELLEAEMALRDQREHVAALRRALPTDTVVETDYVFHEGPADLAAGDAAEAVRLSQLVRAERPLLLMHFMWGGPMENPCPMCSMWADGYNGVIAHLEQRVDFGVVFAGELAPLRAWARGRGWTQLRLLSSAGSDFKTDFGMEDAKGNQLPGVSVFTRGDDGSVRHFYTGSAFMGPGQFRGMDLLSPVWSFFDLTPTGRGDFMPRPSYDP